MKKSMTILIFIIIVIISMTAVFSGCKASDSQSSESNSAGSSDYPNDFSLKDMSGQPVSLSDYKGKIIVLNFWATWCPPCKAEIPDFIEVFEVYKDKEVIFLGVSVDEDINALEEFVKSYEISYPVLVDNKTENVSGQWGVSAIPTTFFLDREGAIIGKRVGMMPGADLVYEIEKALGN